MVEFELTSGRFTLTEIEGRPVEDIAMYFTLLQARKQAEDEQQAEDERQLEGLRH